MTVHVVGAGPGDPDLLTRRAADLLAVADVVVHDGPVGAALVVSGLVAADAARAVDGAPEEVAELLCELAEVHDTVVRLVDGDPNSHAGALAEAAVVLARGIELEIVPGVAPPLAAAGWAGAPLGDTPSLLLDGSGLEAARLDRAVPGGVPHGVVPDGALPDGAAAGRSSAETAAAVAAVLAAGGSVVIRWAAGTARLGAVMADLVDAGMSDDTPVVVASAPGTPSQRSHRTVASELVGDAAGSADPAGTALSGDPAGTALSADPAGTALSGDPAGTALSPDPACSAPSGDPAGARPSADPAGTALSGDPAGSGELVVVLGSAAARDLAWYERLPLLGRRIVVTRTRAQASALRQRLHRLGADVVELPTIDIVEPDDGGTALRDATADAGRYDWVVLTSPNGAERLCAALPDARALGGVKLAAIGPGTAAVLARNRLVADLVPPRYVAESLLEAFPDPPEPGRRVLLARATEARDVLPDGLAERGWEVDVVPAYRTVAPSPDAAAIEALATADVVTFTSSSTVTNFVAAVGVDATPPVVACIGPITAATARELGLDVAVEAAEHTIDGLVAALVAHVASAARGG